MINVPIWKKDSPRKISYERLIFLAHHWCERVLWNKPTNNPIRPHNFLWYTFFDQMAEFTSQSKEKEKGRTVEVEGKKEAMYFSAVQVNEMSTAL